MPEAQTRPPSAQALGLTPRPWQSRWELPPVGTSTPDDQPFFADIRERHAKESRDERQKWVPLRDAALCIWTWGEYPKPADGKFVENFIQNDVIGAQSIMFSEPVAIEVGIQDDGSSILAWYWNGPAELTQQITDPLTGITKVVKVPVAQLGVPAPVADPITGEKVAQPIDEQLAETLRGMGMERYLSAIDNKALADVYQLAFDNYWRKCLADKFLDQFVLTVLKSGWNTGIYQWDAIDGHVLENIPVVNVFPDPTRQFVWTWKHNQVHKAMRLADAQRKFPEHAELLYRRSNTGRPSPIDSQSEMGYQYDRDFQSRMVVFSITWMADQPKPMTVEEAIAGGHVEQRDIQEFAPLPAVEPTLEDIATPQPVDEGTEIPQSPVAQAEQENAESVSDDATEVLPDAAPVDVSAATESTVASPEIPSAPPVTVRTAFFLRDSDTEVTPDDLDWPMRYVLRRFTMLDEFLLEDEESPWPTMEVIHATAIPIEDIPFGIGLPWASRHAQKADSVMANSIANNCNYFGNPPHWIGAALKQRLEQELKTSYIDPSVSLSLHDDDLMNGQPKAGFFQLPPMNQHHIEGRQQMQTDRKELTGYTDAAKGVPVTSSASGELQKITMNAASGVIASLSSHLQGMIEHLAGLMLHSLTHFATAQQIAKCCKRYRPEVIAAIHLNHAPDACWKVDALLASGAGQRRQQRADRLIALNKQVDPASGMPVVDAETLQEQLNLDPETIAQRNQHAVRSRMALMQPPMPPGEEGDAAGGPVGAKLSPKSPAGSGAA